MNQSMLRALQIAKLFGAVQSTQPKKPKTVYHTKKEAQALKKLREERRLKRRTARKSRRINRHG